MADSQTPDTPSTPPGGSSLSRWLLRGVVLGLILAVAIEAGRVLFGRNLHVVIPGRVYRCAQPSGRDLAHLARRLGIRTVVNLRGSNVPVPWYQEECRATHAVGINQEDVWFSAGRLPPVHEVQRLVEIADRAEPPLLLHCRRGADRTGLAAAIILLAQTDSSLSKARMQLGPRYGHVPLGRPAYLDQFLREYASWLARQGVEHTPQLFRRWIARGYRPGGYAARIEALDNLGPLPRNRPCGLRVRVHNTGTTSWPLRAATHAGVHLIYAVRGPEGSVVYADRAGLFDATVVPGEAIELTVALPPLPGPGPYRLWMDMADEQHLGFFQTGSEPWEWEFEVHDQVAPTAGERHPAGLAGLAD